MSLTQEVAGYFHNRWSIALEELERSFIAASTLSNYDTHTFNSEALHMLMEMDALVRWRDHNFVYSRKEEIKVADLHTILIIHNSPSGMSRVINMIDFKNKENILARHQQPEKSDDALYRLFMDEFVYHFSVMKTPSHFTGPLKKGAYHDHDSTHIIEGIMDNILQKRLFNVPIIKTKDIDAIIEDMHFTEYIQFFGIANNENLSLREVIADNFTHYSRTSFYEVERYSRVILITKKDFDCTY